MEGTQCLEANYDNKPRKLSFQMLKCVTLYFPQEIQCFSIVKTKHASLELCVYTCIMALACISAQKQWKDRPRDGDGSRGWGWVPRMRTIEAWEQDC